MKLDCQAVGVTIKYAHLAPRLNFLRLLAMF